MSFNIRDFKVTSLFYELGTSGANSLNELYKEYIQETKKLGEKSVFRNGSEFLAIFLNKALSDEIVVQDIVGLIPEDNEKENEEEDEKHEMAGGEVPDGMTFDEYKQFVVDSLNQKVKNPYDDFSYSSYQALFQDYSAPMKNRKFMNEILETKSIEELNKLFDDLNKAVQDTSLDELKNGLIKRKSDEEYDFKHKHGIEMPTPNVFKYIEDIENKKDVYVDVRKHRHLDLTSINNAQFNIPSATIIIRENRDITSGKFNKLTDLARQGELIYRQFEKTNLNKYEEFTNRVNLNSYGNSLNEAEDYDVETKLIPVINQILVDGVNDELRDSLINEGRSITTYSQLMVYSQKVVNELTPYLNGRTATKISIPTNKQSDFINYDKGIE